MYNFHPTLLQPLTECLQASDRTPLDQGVDVTLSLVCLCDKEIRHVSTNVILVTHGVTAEDFLQATKSQHM